MASAHGLRWGHFYSRSDLQEEFDSNHLPRSPNRNALDAVRGDHQRKFCRKLDRADELQSCSSLGLVTNETRNRLPPKLNTPCLHAPVIFQALLSFLFLL